ncbi:hypothetical protein KY330_04655 [Candidatus Woesearchaeota archaeon]|nr:hypothetical protein [Candidatus Woesearchaeota archaeon]
MADLSGLEKLAKAGVTFEFENGGSSIFYYTDYGKNEFDISPPRNKKMLFAYEPRDSDYKVISIYQHGESVTTFCLRDGSKYNISRRCSYKNGSIPSLVTRVKMKDYHKMLADKGLES